MLILTLFTAFSFLLPDAGRLAQEMGFPTENPAYHKGNLLMFKGELSTMDSRYATISISKDGVFVNANYLNFGELEARGEVPDDENAISVYPYLFNAEIGTWKYFGRTSLGVSASFYEQRIMDYSLSGYYFSLGAVYKVESFIFQGFVRNLGGRNGYVREERYSLPIFAYSGAAYNSKNNRVSLGAVFRELSTRNVIFSIMYSRRVYRKLWAGVEILPEKDASVGYREKYPVRFMIKTEKKGVEFGYQIKVPKGALDFKHTLYLGVKI